MEDVELRSVNLIMARNFFIVAFFSFLWFDLIKRSKYLFLMDKI